MNNKIIKNLINTLMFVFIIFALTNATAQEKSKKQLKEEAKIEKQKKIELLVNSKEFIFNVKTVIPQGGRMVEVSGEGYAVEYRSDTINSYLPFFGRGFNVGYGGDKGLEFKMKPEKFEIEKTKKAYIVKTEVKGENDYFSLLLSVYFDGGAYLTVNSNNRSSISYNGKIEAAIKKK